ncbi:MAG: DUF4340 domain-containing protein [Planctomycetota bacterium]
MTEMAKTMLFVAAAAVSLMVAFAIGPTSDSQNLDDLLGSKLNQFEVDVAKRLKIVKFDQETASTREFEVAENDGLWTIPSKQGYPADAARQMGEAATCLIDREVLRVAAKTAVEHEELGVIDPNTSNLDSKAEGVGTRVTITDSNDSSLADMIIGKPVKDAEGQYYVRNADQDVVYVVNLDPDKLSTKFDDWIEDDLLQLTPMDIQRVNLEDYSAEMQIVMTNQGFEPRVLMDQRAKMVLSYDSDESKWLPTKLESFDKDSKNFVDAPLAEDEEINDDTMRELRNGLDDLLLVDVERKPSGLSSDLKASSDFLTNREAIESLQRRGFIPIGRGEDGSAEIISSEGETICTLKNGVEYVLRFGNLKVDGEEATESTDNDSETPEGETEEGSDDGINRYLFVMVRFNESMIETPALAELPELPAGAEQAASTESTDADSGEVEPAGADDSASAEAPATPQEFLEEQEEEEEAAPESTAADETADPPVEDSNASESVEAATDDASEADELADLIAEREALEKENQRKLNEYQDQLQEGKDRVAELNERFGDWYYVISNDVYKKIHLSREDIVSKKEADDAEAEETDDDSTPAGIPGLPNLPIGNPN